MKHFPRFLIVTVLALLAGFLSSCQQSPPIRGLPKRLPVINLHGSEETPPHDMSRGEYPFDENGAYKTDWVGGSSVADTDDSSWRSSHGGSPTPDRDYTPPPRKKPTPVKKTSSSSSKSRSGSKSVANRGKSTSGKSKSTASRSSSYTIKSGDTLSRIAARNGTTVAKLKAANGLRSDSIRTGKTLKIPR